MKKIVWGGFCLIAGILLFWMFDTVDILYGTNIPEVLMRIAAVVLGISGLVLGFQGLRKD